MQIKNTWDVISKCASSARSVTDRTQHLLSKENSFILLCRLGLGEDHGASQYKTVGSHVAFEKLDLLWMLHF